jgi:hypothetical protein
MLAASKSNAKTTLHLGPLRLGEKMIQYSEREHSKQLSNLEIKS